MRAVYASALALVLIISTGSGAAFAAERALPGDILYPIKTQVSEPVAVALAVSTEDQARVHATLAVRRATEAAALAQKGTLSDAQAETLAAQVDANSVASSKAADTLAAEGKVDASIAVRSSLEDDLAQQAESLAAVSADASTTPASPARKVLARIDTQAHAVAAGRARTLASHPVAPVLAVNLEAITKARQSFQKEEPSETLTIGAEAPVLLPQRSCGLRRWPHLLTWRLPPRARPRRTRLPRLTRRSIISSASRAPLFHTAQDDSSDADSIDTSDSQNTVNGQHVGL